MRIEPCQVTTIDERDPQRTPVVRVVPIEIDDATEWPTSGAGTFRAHLIHANTSDGKSFRLLAEEGNTLAIKAAHRMVARTVAEYDRKINCWHPEGRLPR